MGALWSIPSTADNKFFAFIDKFCTLPHMFEWNSTDGNRFDNYTHAPMTEMGYQNAIMMLHHFKIPYYITRTGDYTYDGHAIDLTKLSNFHAICHEIGHYLVCPPEYISRINYGLGSAGSDICDDEDNSADLMERDDYNEISHEDIYAGVLGQYLFYICGGNITITSGDLGCDEENYVLNHKKALFDMYVKLNILHPENGELVLT